MYMQGLSQEKIKRSPNVLIVGPGQGLASSHNAIWWNLAIFFYVQPENRPSKRRLDGSLAKSLCTCIYALMYWSSFWANWNNPANTEHSPNAETALGVLPVFAGKKPTSISMYHSGSCYVWSFALLGHLVHHAVWRKTLVHALATLPGEKTSIHCKYLTHILPDCSLLFFVHLISSSKWRKIIVFMQKHFSSLSWIYLVWNLL